jgi:hypothetical protein
VRNPPVLPGDLFIIGGWIMSIKVTETKKEYTKDELLVKVGNAKKSLCVIGATVFDLPWKELIDGKITLSNGEAINVAKLGEKFFSGSNDFQICILRESENLIAQYALLSQGKLADEGISFSRGNLNGVKENVIKELKEELVTYAKSKNIKNTGLEPPEDIFKKELTRIADDIIRTYLLNAVKEEDKIPQLTQKVKGGILSYLSGEVRLYWEHASKELGFGKAVIDGAAEFQLYVEKLSQKIAAAFSEIESLKTLDVTGVLKGLGDAYCTDGKINYPIKQNPKDKKDRIVIDKLLKEKIQKIIASFRIDGDDSTTRNANYRLDALREQAEKIASEEIAQKIAEYNNSGSETAQRLFIKDCYMPIPVSLIKIDDELYITHALTKFDSVNKFQYVGKVNSPAWENDKTEPYRSYWITEFQNYYDCYFVDGNGVQKYSTEETSKGDRKEVIDIFNESRVRIGTGPRDAFLSNMAIVKSVVWALIFDRQGNMLIHQRAVNGKDNRGLWDKSVGGHVSVEDLDTIEAIRREITEELYTIENEGQGDHNKIDWLITNKNKIIYLGDWKTGRYPDFKGLNLNSDEYYAFSLNYLDINKKNFRTEIIFTERILPGGKTVKAKCFVDPYLCIVAEDFDIAKLQNSKYAMLTPNELKTCVLTGKIKINKDTRYYDYSADTIDFKVTPDLAYLVNSSIWDDIVTEFSKRIGDSFTKKK